VLNKDGTQMKTLVVYDSMYGNTEKIARAIAAAVRGEVIVKSAATAVPSDLEKIDLFLIGSPTQAGRPLKSMQAFMDSLSESGLKKLKTGVFDTRIKSSFAKLFGYAADKIAAALTKKGAIVLLKAEGFIVKSSKGPLAEGELERAAEWVKKVAEEANKN
jgi:flavodoxin I